MTLFTHLFDFYRDKRKDGVNLIFSCFLNTENNYGDWKI